MATATATTANIKSWLSYWAAAKMVNLDAIRAFDQVYQARKFCACMREGVFTPDQVSDLAIWRALTEMRASSSIARGEG